MNVDSSSGSSIPIINRSTLLGREIDVYGSAEYPFFLAKDVALWIGLTNVSDMIRRIDEDERSKFNLGRQGEAWFITENGLYEVLMQSRKPIAKQFKKGVKEILRNIRKMGSYSVAQSTPSVPAVPQSFSEALMLAARQAEQLEQQQKQIEQLSRQQEQQRARIEADKKQMDALSAKAILADRAFAAEGSFLTISQAAKVLRLPYGATTLFRTLREKGVLFARSNEPRQEYIKKGYFVLVQKLVPRNSHPDLLVTQTLVTQAGLVFISRLLNL